MAIEVIGPNVGGRQAPPGQTFVRKDGTLLLRPEDNPTPELEGGGNFRDILTRAGQEDLIPKFEGFSGALRATLPDIESFRAQPLSAFRDEAEAAAAPFFDKSLEMANRAVEQAREQIREQSQLAERFQEQEEEQFFRVEDKSFARELQRAQEGFAGRGTFTSGFREGNIDQRQDSREEGLEEALRGFGQREEERDLRLEQGIEDIDLREEQQELEIGRRRRADVRSTQQRLSSMNEDLRQQIEAGLSSSFNEFLSQEGAA